jgi:hypothetical protein
MLHEAQAEETAKSNARKTVTTTGGPARHSWA